MVVIVPIGCASLLEDEMRTERPHQHDPYERPPEEQIEVSDFEELMEEILGLIMQHADTGLIVANSYDGDITADVERASHEIMNNDPIGVFAVADITATTNRIVSFFEVEISIEYKRTKQQLDSLVNISTERYLSTELLNIMSDYLDEAVFRTSLRITGDDIIGFARDVYYMNPRRIYMLPVIAVETFRGSGDDKIFEVRFGFASIAQASILRRYADTLNIYVRHNAILAVGETDAEILLSLASNLIASTGFDDGTARTISEHGAQNPAATAYGALVTGNAVGEGFAMAFKALCDELGLDCRVVLGHIDGMVHAWNIVALEGDFYHIDVAMGAVGGIETAFLKTDLDFSERYTWNRARTPPCVGLLTYEDIVGTEEEEEEPDDGTENPDRQPGEDDGETLAPPNSEAEEPVGQSNEETSPPPEEPDDDDE